MHAKNNEKKLKNQKSKTGGEFDIVTQGQLWLSR